MRLLDNLAMLVLLLAGVANAIAHYRSQFNPEARVIGMPFACTALAALGMLGILLLLILAPGWQARGASFLAMALALLAAAGWFHRIRLPFLSYSPRRATD